MTYLTDSDKKQNKTKQKLANNCTDPPEDLLECVDSRNKRLELKHRRVCTWAHHFVLVIKRTFHFFPFVLSDFVVIRTLCTNWKREVKEPQHSATLKNFLLEHNTHFCNVLQLHDGIPGIKPLNCLRQNHEPQKKKSLTP